MCAVAEPEDLPHTCDLHLTVQSLMLADLGHYGQDRVLPCRVFRLRETAAFMLIFHLSILQAVSWTFCRVISRVTMS